MTLIEVSVGMIIVMITMTALLGVLVTSVQAGRVAEGRARATQVAADRLEALRIADWGTELGHYGNDMAPLPAFHDGESVVLLGAVRPAGSQAPLPVKTMAGPDGTSYSIATWVTWSGSSTSAPNSGTTYGARRLSVEVTWSEQRSTRTISTEGLRAPTAMEMSPAVGSVLTPVVLSNPAIAPAQTLTASGVLSQPLMASVTADNGAGSITLDYTDANGPQSLPMAADATGKYWTAMLSAGSGPFVPGSQTFTFTGERSGTPPTVTSASVVLTSASPTTLAVSNVLVMTGHALDANYRTTQELTLSATTSISAISMTATFSTASGTIGPFTLSAPDGRTWTGTVPVGTGPFLPGNVSVVFTARAGSQVSTAPGTVVLSAPVVGAPAFSLYSVTPRLCAGNKGQSLSRPSTITVFVKNVAASDPATMKVSGLTKVSSAGTPVTGGFTHSITVPSGTNMAGAASVGLTATVTRAADGVSTGDVVLSVPVLYKNGSC